MITYYYILLKIIILNFGCITITQNNIALNINIIKVSDDSLFFEIENLNDDTFYILDDWHISLFSKDKNLQIKTFPKFGGMLNYNVDILKICSKGKTIIRLPLNENSCNYEKITFILNPISQKRWKEFQGRDIFCLEKLSVNNRDAINLIATKDYIIEYHKGFIKKE